MRALRETRRETRRRATGGDAVRWVGPGRVAFLGSAGRGHELVPRWLSGAHDLACLYGAGANDSSALRRSVRDFFASGGRRCYVLNAPGLERMTTEPEVANFAGEDGGPGYRTGLQTLNELDDLGVIAAPGSLRSLVERVLADAVERRPSLALVLEGDEVKRERVARLPAVRDGRDGDGASLGGALGRLEEWERGEGASAALPPASIDLPMAGESFVSLGAWRRWEGLRRSLDIGTRWVLFEIQGPFLRPRVERELRGFLYGLHAAGFFPPGAPDECFEVACEESVIESRRGATGRMLIRVRARLYSGAAREVIEVEWRSRARVAPARSPSDT